MREARSPSLQYCRAKSTRAATAVYSERLGDAAAEMTNAAPVQRFDSHTPHDPGGGNRACTGAGDEPAPAAAYEADTELIDDDEVIVPDLVGWVGDSQPGPRRRTGLWQALAVSIGIHVGMVALGAWAVSAGIIPLDLPTLGSRGDLAEAGLTDDPGISALSGSGLTSPPIQAASPEIFPSPLSDEVDAPPVAA